MKKPALVLLVALLTEIMLLGSVPLGQVKASETVNGIITSDTTWTKANSPYTLTGPVSVNQGVTLTIEAGTIVNIDTYCLQVNGTLQVLGSQNSPVQFNGGKILFTEVSCDWDEQSGTGCKIENSVLNETTVYSNVALKFVNSQTSKDITVFGTSENRAIISDNEIFGKLDVSNADISNSQISSGLKAVDSKIVSSVINGGLTGNSLVITNSKIGGSEETQYGTTPAINLDGKVTITNCTISGGGPNYDFAHRLIGQVPAIEIEYGQVLISNNTIEGGIEVSLKDEVFQSQVNEFSYNTVTKYVKIYGDQTIIFGNQVGGSINALGSSVVIQNNSVLGISFGGSQIVVSDNSVVNGSGIDAYSTEGSIVIERNLIYNNNCGIRCDSGGLTIRNNTFNGNQVAVYLSTSDSIEFSYNNILNYSESIIMNTQGDFEAINNYWDTNDQLKIGYGIHDFYDDFNLGKVTYLPALAIANPQALPDPNATPPEMKLNELNQNQLFSILSTLAAVGVVAALIIAGFVLVKRKSSKNPNKQTI
jgi:parallel beta-helix repeat protein